MLPSRDWVNEVPQMIARQEPESLYLDYKESGSLAPRRQGGGIDKQTRAFDVSKDVSAFLNSDGGAIAYGIQEDPDPLKTGGVPLPVFDPKQDGFGVGEVTKEDLENVITGNIYNRPSADLFSVIEVPMQGRVVLIVDIAQSLVGAFQAKDLKLLQALALQSGANGELRDRGRSESGIWKPTRVSEYRDAYSRQPRSQSALTSLASVIASQVIGG